MSRVRKKAVQAAMEQMNLIALTPTLAETLDVILRDYLAMTVECTARVEHRERVAVIRACVRDRITLAQFADRVLAMATRQKRTRPKRGTG